MYRESSTEFKASSSPSAYSSIDAAVLNTKDGTVQPDSQIISALSSLLKTLPDQIFPDPSSLIDYSLFDNGGAVVHVKEGANTSYLMEGRSPDVNVPAAKDYQDDTHREMKRDEPVRIETIQINHVRHLKNRQIKIPREYPHLILTGKNGSGKTSLLDSLAAYIESLVNGSLKLCFAEMEQRKQEANNALVSGNQEVITRSLSELNDTRQRFEEVSGGVSLKFSLDEESVRRRLSKGNLIFAYFKADRTFETEPVTDSGQKKYSGNWSIKQSPRRSFEQYLINLKTKEAMYRQNGSLGQADEIQKWFSDLGKLLKHIFSDQSVKLTADPDHYSFSIEQEGREPFGFNTLPSGFSAELDIIADLILRMSSRKELLSFDTAGIVLIDEIEAHLHIEIQKKVLKMLTDCFPNLQFIISTHSPFVLNSIENACVYDLETGTYVQEGLSDLTRSGIVEGYCNVSELSKSLSDKFEAYKQLASKEKLEAKDYEQIAKLEACFDEIPKYLAVNLTTEYELLKFELHHRES